MTVSRKPEATLSNMTGIKRISGPVSAYTYRLNASAATRQQLRQHTILLLGDVHTSYKNTCDDCDTDPECTSLVDFIKRLDDESRRNNTPLDVYLELPVVPKREALRSSIIRRVDKFLMKNASAGTALMEFFGIRPRYIGQFSPIFRAFRDRIYHHHDNTARSPQQRFHYTDARLDLMIQILVSHPATQDPVEFHRRYDIDDVRELLLAFLLSDDFVRDVGKVIGDDHIVDKLMRRVGPDVLTTYRGKVVHRIAKQVHKLPTPRLREALRAYIRDCVERMCDKLRNVLHYDKVRESVLTSSGKLSGRYAALFRTFVTLDVQLVLMDTYLLARMLRFATTGKQSDRGISVVFAGDAHIVNYRTFFERYMQLEASSVCHVPRRRSNDGIFKSPSRYADTFQRCVRVDAQTAPKKRRCTLPYYPGVASMMEKNAH